MSKSNKTRGKPKRRAAELTKAEVQRAWRRDNADKVRGYSRAYYWRNQKQIRERANKQRNANQAVWRAYRKSWREKNVLKERARWRAWRMKNLSHLYERKRKPEYIAASIVQGARRRARAIGCAFRLNLKDIRVRVLRGVCEVTGARFAYERDPRWRTNPLAPSLDRVNPKKGYTRDNVKVVTWQYNVAKHEFGLEQFAAMALAFVTHNKLVSVTKESNSGVDPRR